MSLSVMETGYLASASYNGDIFLWDTSRYKEVRKFSTDEPIFSIIALNNNFLAVSSNNKINIWDLNNFKLNKTLTGHTDLIYHLVLMKKGYLLSGSADKSIKIWKINSGNFEKTLNEHAKAVKFLVELKNDRFASGSEDMSIKIWDLASNESLISTLIGHSGAIRALVELENGYLASSASDSLIFIWDLNRFKLVKTLETIDSAYSLGLLKSGELVNGLRNGYIQIWNKTDLSLIKSVFIDDEEIRCLSLLQNGYLAMGLANRVLNILKIHY